MTRYEGDMDGLRREWRRVRQERLRIRDSLAGKGIDRTSIRKNREYRELKKRQKSLSNKIRHLEGRKSRRIAGEKKRET